MSKKPTPYRYWSGGDWTCCNCHKVAGCSYEDGDSNPLVSPDLADDWVYCPYCGIKWLGEPIRHKRYYVPPRNVRSGFVIFGRSNLDNLRKEGFINVSVGWNLLCFLQDQEHGAALTAARLKHYRTIHPTWDIRVIHLNEENYDKRHDQEFFESVA